MMQVPFPATNRPVEELLFHWPTVLRLAPEGFAANFARSIARQSRRRGWRPTDKQLRIMERLVADLFAPRDDDLDVIEDEDRAA